ncbi:hypothetical protein BST97_03235 [Nonlabens spongiae]|uniref:Uncharacterized protein n=1 Tax=Nonlabens spongiae TaxID=331648 RepID=A0A1W6MHK9_9FLAO|nr:DUF6090 family protein [Nonlabens spongiae]ARN77088.1 hypothetical protein BST97_03235 [Nonlabens spongiae]
MKGFKKYVVYALGEIILVVIGILIALGINDWNENRIKKNEQEIIAKAVLKQMKRDLYQVEDQLEYMEGEEEIYDLFLTDRELNENENIRKLQRGPFLITTGFKILHLETKTLELLKQRNYTKTDFNEILDKIEIQYVYSHEKLEMSEKIIVEELLANLEHIKSNYDWYYKLVTHGNLDVSEFKYFGSADYRNRVAHMSLVAMDGYQYDVYELSEYLCKYINDLELVLE